MDDENPALQCALLKQQRRRVKDWGQVDYRKVRQRISEVIQDLASRAA